MRKEEGEKEKRCNWTVKREKGEEGKVELRRKEIVHLQIKLFFSKKKRGC